MRNIFGLMALGLLLTACGSPKESPASLPESAKVRVAIHFKSQDQPGFSLSRADPLFLGLGVQSQGQNVASVPLHLGDNFIELPVGKPLDLTARVVYFSQSEESKVRYFVSDASTNNTLTKETSEVVLSFGAFKEVKAVNVYGLAVENGSPAGGWRVTAHDPLTRASITLPGENFLVRTGDDGKFQFRFFFAENASNDARQVKLDFVSPQGEVISRQLSFPAISGSGFSAGYINLSGFENIMLGKSPEDYDGDGFSNLTEEFLGTNPFSPNTDGCTPAAQVLKGFNYTCSDGTRLTGELALTSGLNCWDGIGDLNGDGVANALDCRGARGETGLAGTQGGLGPKGEAGRSVGFAVQVEAPGANCGAGGKKISLWQDINSNSTYEPASDTDLHVSYVCNGDAASVPSFGLYTSGDLRLGSYVSSGGSAYALVDGAFLALSEQGVGTYSAGTSQPVFYGATACSGAAYTPAQSKQALPGAGGFYTYNGTGSATGFLAKSDFSSGTCNDFAATPSFVNSLKKQSENEFVIAAVSIKKIATSGSTVFAATDGAGLQVSSNSGVNWLSITTFGGVEILDIKEVAVFGSTVALATAQGLVKSTDGGATWSVLTTLNGLPTNLIQGVFVDDTGLIYFAADYFGAYTLTAGGVITQIFNGYLFPSSPAKRIVVDAAATVYIASSEGFFRKATGDTGWTGRLYGTNIRAVAVASGVVYIGTNNGLKSSVDGGVSWTDEFGTTGTLVEDISGDGTRIFAAASTGVWVKDGGNWTQKTSGAGFDATFAIHSDGSSLFVGSSSGATANRKGRLSLSSNVGVTFSHGVIVTGQYATRMLVMPTGVPSPLGLLTLKYQ